MTTTTNTAAAASTLTILKYSPRPGIDFTHGFDEEIIDCAAHGYEPEDMMARMIFAISPIGFATLVRPATAFETGVELAQMAEDDMSAYERSAYRELSFASC
jgi:hypothetical protein